MTTPQAVIFAVLAALVIALIVKARARAEIAADAPPTRLEMAHILKNVITGLGILVIALGGGVIVIGNIAKEASEAAENAEQAVAAAESERLARVSTVSDVINVLCLTNNSQDLTLGDLVAVSIAPEDAFGSTIDPNDLDTFDLQVLASIARIQEIQGESPLVETFRETLRDLQDLTPCKELLEDYRDGGEIDVQQIIGPNQSQDELSGEKKHPAKP